MTAVETEQVPVTALTGTPTAPLDPGTVEWLKTMSASKVAAALGVSPYESPFSLWHRMANLIPGTSDAPHLARGHYLEPGIVAWFNDEHPDWTIQAGGSWAHPEKAHHTASPDRVLYLPGQEIRGLEVKTAANDDEWGTAGTDEIPVGYRAQVMWQMYVLGTRITHVAVLSAYLEMREYVVVYSQTEVDFIVEQAQAFEDSLPTGPRPQRPSIDTHSATYEALRQLHPEIDGSDVELDPETAQQYCHAIAAAKKAKTAETYAKSLLLDEMGQARRARYLGQTIATRQPNGDHNPKLVAGRNLPNFDQEAEAS